MERVLKKVLLLGTDGFSGRTENAEILSVSWQNLPKLRNLADYDLAVVDLLPLSEKTVRDAVNWQQFERLFTTTSARRILANGGEIIVLGDPRFSIPTVGGRGTVPFLYWSGLIFQWDAASGDTIEVGSNSYCEWFSPLIPHFKRWDYSLSSAAIDRRSFPAEKWAEFEREELRPVVEVSSVCENRYRHPLVFSIRVHLMRYEDAVLTTGPIHFVPALQTADDEALHLVLRHLCGIETLVPPPTWIESMMAPGQAHIDSAVLQIEEQIARQTAKLTELRQSKMECRRFLQLLFEKDFVLEEVVRNALRELGATVEDPIENNKEDGWIVVTVGGQRFEGVLEIKSTRNDTLNEAGRKQLTDWVDRGITLREKKYKGIFIGNSAIAKAPAERPEPFGDGWKKALALSGYCALKTTDLYRAYEALRAGSFNHDQFWTSLFSTNGVLDIGQALGIGQDRATT